MIDARQSPAEIQRQLLGWGAAAHELTPGEDIGRDLALVAGEGGIDLDVVSGIENLDQCLEIGLTTARGGDVFNVEFGFDGINALVEEQHPMLVRERVRVAVIQLLQRDPRVRRIIDLKLLDGRMDRPETPAGAGDADGAIESRLERWRRVEVVVAFETISGDQAVISLGKVVGDA